MQQKLTYLLLCFFISSCIQHKDDDADISISELPKTQLDVKYAQGFEIEYTTQYTSIISKSINGNTFFRDSILILHTDQHDLKDDAKIISVPLEKSCLQSSTYFGFINYLDEWKTVKGLCGLQFVDGIYKDMLETAGTNEICTGENLITEDLLKINPELYFTYPFESEDNSELDEKGINTFMIAEYLETHPIARLEWIKVFGIIYGKPEQADAYFNQVEEEYYDLIVEAPDTAQSFIFNVPWGDSWWTPSSNSLIVKLLQDAGLYYYFQHEVGTENTPHSKEEIWEAGAKTPYWVIIASRDSDFSLSDLLAEEDAYSSFRSVKERKVIFCNTSSSDYFIQGVLEPQIMIKDILFATGKIDEYDPKYFHLLK